MLKCMSGRRKSSAKCREVSTSVSIGVEDDDQRSPEDLARERARNTKSAALTSALVVLFEYVVKRDEPLHTKKAPRAYLRQAVRIDSQLLHSRDKRGALEAPDVQRHRSAPQRDRLFPSTLAESLRVRRFSNWIETEAPLPLLPSSPIGTSSAEPRVKITERSMKFSSSRMFPGQSQLESFFMAAAGIDSICFSIRRPYFWAK